MLHRIGILEESKKDGAKPDLVPQVSDWYGISGTTVGIGSVIRSGGVSWGNKAWFDIAEINEDFTLEYNLHSVASIGFVGIQDFNAMGYLPNYSFYNNQSALDIREGWTAKNSLGGFNTSTLFSIKRVAGAITFYMDGVLKYTSLNSFNGKMKFGCSCYHLSSGAKNLIVKYN